MPQDPGDPGIGSDALSSLITNFRLLASWASPVIADCTLAFGTSLGCGLGGASDPTF